MEIHIDQLRCIGSGQCAITAAGVFEINDDGVSEVVDAELTKQRPVEVEEAVGLCPMEAISIVEP